jgi:hypothetical protein
MQHLVWLQSLARHSTCIILALLEISNPVTFTEPLFSRRLVSWHPTSLWHHFLCNRIDILRVQDINWWQQGLYPGECRVSLLELGSSGVHALSMAIKCEKNKIIYVISRILARQTLYQTRLNVKTTKSLNCGIVQHGRHKKSKDAFVLCKVLKNVRR